MSRPSIKQASKQLNQLRVEECSATEEFFQFQDEVFQVCLKYETELGKETIGQALLTLASLLSQTWTV